MAERVARRWCKTCEETVRCTAPRANHLLHLILTMVTFGLWVIVWLIVANANEYRCATCATWCPETIPQREKRLRRAERKATKRQAREAKAMPSPPPEPIPPKPSVLHEQAHAEWMAKYGDRDR